MRVIKFRAWDKKRGVIMEEVKQIHFYYAPPGGDEIRDRQSHEVVYGWDEDGDSRWGKLGHDCKLLQFTGLKDKLGIEIYEGDIIGYQYWSHIEMQYDVVEWNDDCYGFSPMAHHEYTSHGDETEHTYKVFGNIYEHPDLLDRLIEEEK